MCTCVPATGTSKSVLRAEGLVFRHCQQPGRVQVTSPQAGPTCAARMKSVCRLRRTVLLLSLLIWRLRG